MTFRQAAALIYMAVTFNWIFNNVPLVKVIFTSDSFMNGLSTFVGGGCFIFLSVFLVGYFIGWESFDD